MGMAVLSDRLTPRIAGLHEPRALEVMQPNVYSGLVSAVTRSDPNKSLEKPLLITQLARTELVSHHPDDSLWNLRERVLPGPAEQHAVQSAGLETIGGVDIK